MVSQPPAEREDAAGIADAPGDGRPSGSTRGDGAEASGEVLVVNPHGLHLRPATRFAKAAMEFACDITVTLDGDEVDGKSILMLSSLAAECGVTLQIRASGTDAAQAVATLVALVGEDHGERSGQ